MRAADPEVILIAPCGYDLARSVAEGERLLALADWQWARERRVWAVDANAFASRPGPRLIDGIECFARIFNPALFSPIDPRFAQPLTDARASHAGTYSACSSRPAIAFLKRLLDTPGPVGLRGRRRQGLARRGETFAADVHADVHGNSMAVVNPKRRAARSCSPATSTRSA